MTETLTDLEIDAALAAGIGWTHICQWKDLLLGQPPEPPSVYRRQVWESSQIDGGWGCVIPDFTEHPTWESSGQLIEGLAVRGYFVETRNDDGNPDEVYAYTSFTGPSGLTLDVDGFGPKAIAEAAVLALGIKA